MTKYTFLFVALLLILLPFFGLKEVKEDAKEGSNNSSTVRDSDGDKK